MKPQELNACVKRLSGGLSEQQLLKLVGVADKAKITAEQARCIRALVLHEDIREYVLRVRQWFPNAVFTGVRSTDGDKR